MGILKTITEEYFGETVRKEDMIDLTGLDVKIVSFTDNNKKFHKTGYKPKNKDNLKKLLKRMIEMRGDDGDFNDIDTSDIEDMSFLFSNNETFNGDITGWDVSKVENMKYMFYNAYSFNQHIGKWNVSKVTNMIGMFYHAKSFNQPIGDWEIPEVKSMNYMFYKATSFSQDLSKWDLNGKNKLYMFNGCLIKNEYKPKMNKE
jgi:surface protein